MSAELFAVGLEFGEGGLGFVLIGAVLVCIALVVLAVWFVLRDDPPGRESDRKNGRTDDGW